MKLNPHSQFGQLHRLLAANSEVLCHSWKGSAYRCAGLEYASAEKLISGEGTLQYGARWMAPGAERVVHLSTTEMTAIQESRGHFVRYGLNAVKPGPRVLVTLEVEVSRLLDLFRLDSLRSGFTIQEMLDDDWEGLNQRGKESISQALGRAAFSLGYEAILAPSAVFRRRRNVVVFPENLAYASRFAIVHEDTLRQWLG
jgi:RES domain-containing protein